MKTLLDDYKRKLVYINDMIANNKNNGSINDERRDERFKTKASVYRSFIVDIERMIQRNQDDSIQPEIYAIDLPDYVCDIDKNKCSDIEN